MDDTSTTQQLDESSQEPVQAMQDTPTSDAAVADQAANDVSIPSGGSADLLDKIIFDAFTRKASDIHLEPREKDLLVRFRMDGILNDMYTVNKTLEKTLIFIIKVKSKLRTDEHFAPQDGKIRFDFQGTKLDTRISLIPVTKGEKVVIRLLSQQDKSFALGDLGMRPNDLDKVKKGYMKPYGSIFASGPTGSGKTTSLYSILQTINSREKNITTIEDPVEYEIEGVNHIQINQKAGMTFERGLRAILRQDPDIVMVGEIRDSETAQIAINAAMTGHLVLSTIHTNDAITTVPRLIDMGVNPYLVASTLNIVIAQRLSRKLCVNCKKEYQITKEEYEDMAKFRPDITSLIKPGDKFYKPQGCDQCHSSGYKGRIGLYEVLEITESIRKVIVDNIDADQIFKIAREEGLILIVEDGVNKLREGLISMDELLRVTALKN